MVNATEGMTEGMPVFCLTSVYLTLSLTEAAPIVNGTVRFPSKGPSKAPSSLNRNDTRSGNTEVCGKKSLEIRARGQRPM